MSGTLLHVPLSHTVPLGLAISVSNEADGRRDVDKFVGRGISGFT
jgi:hypothetical protein